MSESRQMQPEAQPSLECKMCLKEIPVTAAFTPEGAEYVGYFCGIECYQAFLRKHKEGQQP